MLLSFPGLLLPGLRLAAAIGRSLVRWPGHHSGGAIMYRYRLTVRYWETADRAWTRHSLDTILAMAERLWRDSSVKSMVVDDILDGLTVKTWRP
jgi:hypothetical protein